MGSRKEITERNKQDVRDPLAGQSLVGTTWGGRLSQEAQTKVMGCKWPSWRCFVWFGQCVLRVWLQFL